MLLVRVLLTFVTSLLSPSADATASAKTAHGDRGCVASPACADQPVQSRVCVIMTNTDARVGPRKVLEELGPQQCCVVVRKGPWMPDAAASCCEPAVVSCVLVCDDEDPPGSNEPQAGKKIVIRRLDDEPAVEAGGPWLGIQFGPVSKPLASHLNLDDGTGQMVLNVIEGSPADQAGLEQYDVITRLDGKDVAADMGEFLGLVKSLEVGQACPVSLYRGGRQVDTNITVSERPEQTGSPKYKYEDVMEELSQDNVFHRGMILRKDPSGNWMFGGPDELKDLPKFLRKLPGDKDFDFLFELPSPPDVPGSQTEVRIQTENGQTVEVRRQGDEITVTRTTTDDDGKTSTVTKTYANEDELKKDDPEAHKLLKQNRGFRWMSKDGQGFFFGPGDRQKLFDRGGKMGEEGFGGKAKDLGDGDSVFARRPRTSFETLEDGKIRVTVRKGDEELVQTFDSVESLRKARPDLYAKYKKLQDRGSRTEGGQSR